MFYAILGRIKYYSFFCGNTTLYRMATPEDRYISLLTDSPEELYEYEDSLKTYRDLKNSLDTADC